MSVRHTALPSLADTARGLARREISPVELVHTALRAADRLNPVLNAYITVVREAALDAARAAERDIEAGRYRGPLHGIPVSVKDIYWTRGVRTTAGSRILTDFVPAENSAVVDRLAAAGAILVAKANTMEFAYASVHPDFGPPKNPWDTTRATGGSSSGSAAAVAAGLDFGSFGSDTGGSTRIPAAFCGLTGLKPTYGLVSRFGLVPLSWTLDHPGVLGRSAADVALLLQGVAGRDPRDESTSAAPPVDAPAPLGERLDGVTVAVLTNLMDADAAPEIRTAVRQSVDVLAGAGARIREIAVPELAGEALEAHMRILLPEASYCHRDWLATRAADYTDAVRTRLEAGTRTTAVAYVAALRMRERLRARIRALQQEIDLFVLPTTPMPAPPLGGSASAPPDVEELKARMRRTAPFNLLGTPALSVPCGFSSEGLPIALQIVGRDFEDGLVLRAGHAFQTRTDWHLRRPPASAGA
ncbi:MAG TPA: amidase [bacterium]|nr:amidase [bacterium]